MDAKADTPNDLSSLLKADHIGYTSLFEILKREKQLLIERNFDTFVQTLEEKHQLVGQLDQLTQHRFKVLEALKLEPNEAGMQELINRQPEFGRAKLLHQWEEIKLLVKNCNRQNEVNSKIAHRAQSTSRHVLNILKGATLRPSLYDKTGATGATGTGLSITAV